MALSTELRTKILQQAKDIDKVSADVTARVATTAKNQQSAQIASRLDNPINSPSVQAKRSAQIARNLDNSLINKATTGTTNPAEMYRPGNVTESWFKSPNYVSNSAMTEMVDRANARLALQQDNTAAKQAREATRKSTEQQKAAMERMVADLYQKMEGYKNNGQTDELLMAEQQYSKLNESIAQMQSKLNGSAMEEAKDWETRRYNEIMATGGRVLMANLEQLVELSDRRISEADDERKNGLTETQKQYNELYKSLTDKYGSKVDGWLEYAKRAENKSQMAMRMVQAKNAAENHPFWASVGSVPLNLASGAGYMDVLGQKLQRFATGSDAPIDYNSPAQSASKMTNTIRGTVSEGMGGVGKFLYNTGMSMADSLVAMPMGNFGMALLGGSAATNAMQTAIERGASDDQALKIGLVAGAMEAALEKTSIDSLFNLTDSKTIADFFTNAFKQSGAELTEEGLTKLGNTFADAVIMGNKSELNASKRGYIADGYSPEKAEGMALKDWGVDLLLDMAGGAFSGGVFGSFKSGFDVVRNGGFQKPTVESVMPKPKQETQTQPPVADITPTPQQAQEAPTPASVMPKLQQTETVPVAEFRQTAAEILSEGIFDSPTYGEALEQTGMKRADVRDALRAVARNNIAAASDPKVQVVLNVIRNVDAHPVQAQVKAPTQTTPEQTVSEMVSRMVGEPKGTAENANFVNEAPKMQDDIHEIEPDAKPAMGAADSGFDPISHASIKYGAIPPGEKASRIVDLPVSTDGKTKVGHFARTAAESPVTDDEMAQRILDLVAENKVSHEIFTDDAALEAAGAEIADAYKNGKGYSVYTRFLQDVAEGKAGKDLSATGNLLYADAVAAKDYESAAELFLALDQLYRRGGQTTQSARLLKKLSPEGRTWAVQKTVDKINKDISSEGRKGTELGSIDNKTKADVNKAIGEARETALRQLSGESTQNTNKKRDHGVPVEDWVQEIGKEVAKALDAKPKVQKPKPISRVIRQDILALAKPHWPQAPKAKTTKRTAADTLTDFFANKKQYVEAWNAALEEYRKTHDLGEDFVGANGPGPEKMMVQAIVDEIAAQELKKQKIELFSYLGDQASIEKQIADGLIKRTKADGDNADMIRRAVSQYVNGVRYEANIERISAGLSRDIRNIVEEIGGNMYEIVRDNKGNKAGAAKIVADLMVKRYKISKDAAKTASSKIVERFNSLIAEQTQKTLDAMFADKKKGATKSAVQKITEMGNLGAFDDSRYRDAAVQKAQDTIDAGIGSAIKKIGAKTADIIRSNKADRAVVANQIKDMLMQDHRLHKEDAQRLSEFILDCFDRRVNASAKKALENYVKPKDKKTQKTLDQRFRELANMGAFSGNDFSYQITRKLFGSAVQIDPDLLDKYANATDPDELRTAGEELYHSIGRQIPSNFKDKWNAWRHMGMLGTFKAPERNFIGNTAGQVMRVTKNAFSGAGQALFVDKSERTRAVLPAGRELVQAAKNDIKNVEQELKGIGKNHIVNDQIQEGRQIFTPHLANAVRKVMPELPEWADNVSLEGARKLINKAMSDGVFSKGTYVDALSSFLKARGYTAADFTGDGMTEAQKAEARDYAISEALKATYRDRSVVSELITSARFNPNKAKSPKVKMAMEVANAGLEGIMPYLKTPANVLARGIEYDPVLGTISTIINAAYAKKQGDFKASDLVDDISKVLTGGAIATIGYFMRANNMIKGSSDDEDQEDLEGQQEYSLTIGGKSIPIDWMAPFCMPLFMGVELYDMLDRGGGSAPLTSKIAGSLTSLSSAMLNTSMLDGLQDMIDNVKYADSAPIALVANAALGYLGQGVPTLFGQLERAFNSPVQEMTFIDKNNKWLGPDAQRALGTLSKKIPGWDYNQIPYIDRWGRTVDNGGVGKRIVNQLFNPANTSEIKETPVDAEIKRLEQVLGDGYNLTPSKAQSTLTIDKKKIILTADEYLTYAQAKGQNDLTFRQNLIDSDLYAELDDETKAAAMDKSQDLANALAIQEAGFKPNMAGWEKDLIGADAETITSVLIAKALESRASAIDTQEGIAEKTKQAYFTDLLNDLNATAAKKREFWLAVGYAESKCPY